MDDDKRVREALKETEILYQPQQLLDTFGSSTVKYYVLSESICDELTGQNSKDTVIRKGELIWEPPRVLSPIHMLKMEGFNEKARQAIEMIAKENPNLAAFFYSIRYEKRSEEMHVVNGSVEEASERIINEIERDREPLTAVIKGVGGYWDVSLMKFIQDMVIRSAKFSQFPDLKDKGLIKIDESGYPVVTKDSTGVPLAAKNKIESMFSQVSNGELEAKNLKEELDKWGLFEQYEDRFLNLFKDDNS